MKIVHGFIFVREINIVRTANSIWLGSLDILFSCVFVDIQNTEAMKNINASEMK